MVLMLACAPTGRPGTAKAALVGEAALVGKRRWWGKRRWLGNGRQHERRIARVRRRGRRWAREQRCHGRCRSRRHPVGGWLRQRRSRRCGRQRDRRRHERGRLCRQWGNQRSLGLTRFRRPANVTTRTTSMSRRGAAKAIHESVRWKINTINACLESRADSRMRTSRSSARDSCCSALRCCRPRSTTGTRPSTMRW